MQLEQQLKSLSKYLTKMKRSRDSKFMKFFDEVKETVGAEAAIPELPEFNHSVQVLSQAFEGLLIGTVKKRKFLNTVDDLFVTPDEDDDMSDELFAELMREFEEELEREAKRMTKTKEKKRSRG
jgi:hypothetical protein